MKIRHETKKKRTDNIDLFVIMRLRQGDTNLSLL